MEIKDKDKKRTIISIVITILIHGLFILLLMVMGLKYPDPPPPEEGVELDMGMLTDVGNAMAGEPGGSENPSSSSNVVDNDEYFASQSIEDVHMSSKKTNQLIDKSKPKNKVTPQTNEPQFNPNALYQKGKIKNNTGSGSGGGIGDGKGKGNDGGGGTGNDNTGSGTSFSLGGRSAKKLGLPTSKTDDVGDIVVSIWVDQNGVVTRAVAGARGTTIDNKSLWRHCEYAARQSKFSPKSNAPEEQKGTITYKFKR